MGLEFPNPVFLRAGTNFFPGHIHIYIYIYIYIYRERYIYIYIYTYTYDFRYLSINLFVNLVYIP